jgi:predicted phosphodiesterase
VVLFGDTHEEVILHWDGVMIMNPGSPTYPGKRHKRGFLGTIGLLEIDGEEANGQIINLEDSLI